MSKKHFIAIAKILNMVGSSTGYDRSTATAIAHSLADVFQEENPRFDRSRFLDACGVTVTIPVAS